MTTMLALTLQLTLASTVFASPAVVASPRPVAAHVRTVAQGTWRQPVQAQPVPARPAPPPVVAYPTQAPPPPVVERVTRRRGWMKRRLRKALNRMQSILEEDLDRGRRATVGGL